MAANDNEIDLSTATKLTLYYRDGNSDKVYQAEIVAAAGELYTVNFAYGRRGNAMQTGTKTSSPVPMAKARGIFEKLLREKMAKGYTPGADGTPYRHTGAGEAHTGIACQLLNAIDETELARLLADPAFVAQEKLDGRRMLVRRHGDDVIGINRRGLAVGLPEKLIDVVKSLAADFVLDGEAVGDVLHVFDVLERDGVDLRQQPYGERLKVLNCNMPGMITNESPLQLVRTAFTEDEKTAMHERLLRDGREGIVLKRASAPYVPGRPSSGGNQLKYKYYDTVTCVVTAQNAQRSIALALTADGGQATPCGNVSVPPNQPIPAVGDIVEVRYLYAFPQSNVLYQPVLLGVRDDIGAEDCVLSQLKYKPA